MQNQTSKNYSGLKTSGVIFGLIQGFLASSAALAGEPAPYVALISQDFTRSTETPSSLKEGMEGDLNVEIYLYGEWEDSAFEIKLSKDGGATYVSKTEIDVPVDYPSDLSAPKVTELEGRRVRFTIPKVNALLHSSFEISVRALGSSREPTSPWVSFQEPLLPVFTVGPMSLPSVLAHPPVASGAAELESWIDALLQETLKPVGAAGTATIRIAFSEGYMNLPILLAPSVSYSPDLAPSIAETIRQILPTVGASKAGKLEINLVIDRDHEGTPVYVGQISDLTLGLDRVSD